MVMTTIRKAVEAALTALEQLLLLGLLYMRIIMISSKYIPVGESLTCTVV
jgi:hypothetical protein